MRGRQWNRKHGEGHSRQREPRVLGAPCENDFKKGRQCGRSAGMRHQGSGQEQLSPTGNSYFSLSAPGSNWSYWCDLYWFSQKRGTRATGSDLYGIWVNEINEKHRGMNHEVLVYEWRWYFQLLWISHTPIHSRNTVITISLNVIWKHTWGFNQNTGGNTSHKHTKKLSKRGHRFYLAILTCIT